MTHTVAVCDSQPITAEGLRCLIKSWEGFAFGETSDSLANATTIAARSGCDLLVLDKAFGLQAVMETIVELRHMPHPVGIIVWGVALTETEALRLLQVGAKGILRKSASLQLVESCMRSVAAGSSWMEDGVFREAHRGDRYPRSELTPREQQVLELVEQGSKNREIALELGIRPGTVKIHLKHIFEKTGVRGRFGLALNGLKDRGVVRPPAAGSRPAVLVP
ncbi:MAG: response regulator transcription factor [Bryobacteraceae bacterium]